MHTTPEQINRHISRAAHALARSPYNATHEGRGIFKIEGHHHDLGAADPDQIERIVSEGLMRM